MSALKFTIISVSLTLVSFTLSVHSLSSGAPLKVCTSLTPGHWWNHTTPIEPRQDEPPYTIAVNTSMVGQGDPIEVTIYGELFQGFLLQARVKDTTTPIGQFTLIPYLLQPRDCNATSDSVTHKDPRDKPNGTTLTWTAPSHKFGDFYFIATVAKNHDAFWVGIKSDTLEYTDGEETTTPGKPTTEPEPTTQSATWIVPSLSAMMSLLIAAFVIYY
ncbi:putative defense protein 3 [Amphiura filiformis]|uniref:putative defense protein 3 n=1 Tax=Amphiura filiformis TaxID=82378 RepID=UPI003B2281FF